MTSFLCLLYHLFERPLCGMTKKFDIAMYQIIIKRY